MTTTNDERALLPADLAAIAINAFFAVASFANIGKSRIAFPGGNIDREALMGAIFLAFVPAQIALIHFLNPLRNRLVRFVRLFHSQALMPLWFTESIVLSQLFSGGASLDRIFADADFFLFGFQPSIEFHRALHGPYWTELFFFGYFTYYFLITAGWWMLFLRGKDDEAANCLFVVTASFGALFLWYSFFPVMGPKYHFRELRAAWYGNFKGYLFTALLKRVFDAANLGGAAFPSSHVAISLISLILNAKLNRRLLPLLIPLTGLLFLSTVYLYAHYAVDVFAGVAFGIALYPAFALPRSAYEKAADGIGRFMMGKFRFNPIGRA